MLMQQLAAETSTTKQKEELVGELNRVQITAENARAAETRRYQIETNRQMVELRKSWNDTTTAMNQLSVNWANSFMNNLVDLISGTKVNWRGMVQAMAKDLLTIMMRKELGNMVMSMSSSIAGYFGSALGLGGAASSAAQAAQTTAITTAMTTMTTETTVAMTGMTTAMGELALAGTGGMAEMTIATTAAMTEMAAATTAAMSAIASAAGVALFAEGGVMTSQGPLPLNMYANGGVASTPQMAIFGEGSTPEAYVPLPDGRSIPVTMKTDGINTTTTTNNAGGVQINISVTNSGEKSDAHGTDAETWKNVAEKVRSVVMEQLVVQQRPGGVLYGK